jgi:predicted SAM-dependent methyltransferase
LAFLEDNSLDAILSFNVLAYLTDDQEDLFYRQAFRLLRTGGYLIVTREA